MNQVIRRLEAKDRVRKLARAVIQREVQRQIAAENKEMANESIWLRERVLPGLARVAAGIKRAEDPGFENDELKVVVVKGTWIKPATKFAAWRLLTSRPWDENGPEVGDLVTIHLTVEGDLLFDVEGASVSASHMDHRVLVAIKERLEQIVPQDQRPWPDISRESSVGP